MYVQVNIQNEIRKIDASENHIDLYNQSRRNKSIITKYDLMEEDIKKSKNYQAIREVKITNYFKLKRFFDNKKGHLAKLRTELFNKRKTVILMNAVLTELFGNTPNYEIKFNISNMQSLRPTVSASLIRQEYEYIETT